MFSSTYLAAVAALLTTLFAQTTDPVFYTFAPDNTTIGQPLVLKYGPDNAELVTIVLLHVRVISHITDRWKLTSDKGTTQSALTAYSTLFSTTGGSFTWTPSAPAGSTYGLEILGAGPKTMTNYGNFFTLVAATGTSSQAAIGYQPVSTPTPAPTLTSSMSMTTSPIVIAPGPASVSMSMTGLITPTAMMTSSMTTMTSMPTFTPSTYVHPNGTTVTTTVCGCMLDKPIPGPSTAVSVSSMPAAEAAPFSNGTMTTSVAGVAAVGTGAPMINVTSFTMATASASATPSGIIGQIGNGAGSLSMSMGVVAALAGACALLL
jgi:hypothetical protein